MLKILVTVIVFLMIMLDMVLVPVHSQQENGEKEIVHADHNVASSDAIFWKKKTVRVKNDLNNSNHIYLHCKSKNDDLQLHDLGPGQFQQWSFYENVWGTTLYWCSMATPGFQTTFDIYNFKDEVKYCNSECNRSVRRDGLWFYIQFEDYWEKRLSWNIP